MEIRYVFRGIEDAIGSGLPIEDSPHAIISRRLRFAYREQRDSAFARCLSTVCSAAFAGNSRIDIQKINDLIADNYLSMTKNLFPYLRTEAEESKSGIKSENYEEYFKELEEMEKNISRGNKSNGQGKSGNDNVADSSESDIVPGGG